MNIRIDADQLSAQGYARQTEGKAFENDVVSLSRKVRSGQLSGQFNGNSGDYTVKLAYIDSDDGRAVIDFSIAGKTQHLQLNEMKKSRYQETVLFDSINLKQGERFSIAGKADGKDHAQVDWIEFIPVNSKTSASVKPLPTKPDPSKPVTPKPSPGHGKPVTPDPLLNPGVISLNFAGDWQRQWGISQQGEFGEQNMKVVDDLTGQFGQVLRVQYPAGSASPAVARADHRPLGGAQFLADLPQVNSSDSMTLDYWVRFSDNFDFVKGGKLPGLYGGNAPSGGDDPDGTDGFSTRFMWRSGGDGELYAYLPNHAAYGTSIGRGNWEFKPGDWHHIRQEIRMNTPGRSDGISRVEFDGKTVLNETDLTYRTAGSLQNDGIFFSTFFGGGDASWATPKNVYADFANFSVSTRTVT